MASSAADCRAAVSVVNIGQTAKNKLYFRLAKLAKVTSATINGAPAQFETLDDRRVPALSQVVVSSDAGVQPGATARIEFAYRIEAPESTNLIHIYAGEVMFAPEAIWVPMPTTPFTPYGPTTAPFSLEVTAAGAPNGFKVASAGAPKSQ